MSEEHSFLLQRVQPAMVGLIDGSLSTLAPIFGIVVLTPSIRHTAFVAGLATSIGAGDLDGVLGGPLGHRRADRPGQPVPARRSITGVGTFVGGILHTLPFLIPNYHAALIAPSIVVAFELDRPRDHPLAFLPDELRSSLAAVSLGGAVIVAISAALGATA